MNFLFSTGSLWSYSIERVFGLAAAAGYDGLELLVDARWETRQPDLLQRLMDRHQLPVRAIHSPFWFAIPGWPADQPGRIRCSVELAQQLGAGVVVHHLPTRVGLFWVMAGARLFPLPVPGLNPERGYKRWLEREYAAFQATTDVALCIENMPAYRRLGRRWHYCYWNRPQEITRFPHLTMDTTHLGTWDLQPADIYPQWGKQVRHIHLSNYHQGREHQRPEVGELQLDKLLGLLAAAAYPHHITLELTPDSLNAGQPDEQVLERMAASLEYCRVWV